MIGSFGPTGPKFVTYSSAAAGVTPAMKSAAQAIEVERSSWTIWSPFGLGRFRENELAAMHNLTPHCSVKFVLQCGTTGRGLMEFKDGRVRLRRHEGHDRRQHLYRQGRY
jgi:hypothetical protein